MSFEETELRLGLPGREILTRKRGFHETAAMEGLKLNLTSSTKEEASYHGLDPNPKPPPPKMEVVGWPPLRTNRKNIVMLQKGKNRSSSSEELLLENNNSNNNNGGWFVKVSVDGAPYLRKVDLSIFNSYKQLSLALATLFAPFTIIRNCGSQAAGMKDVLDGFDYVHTYQDKDGDWMLVGDVPWQMFVESCKRLRIMKGKEAIGLAPRTIEKCKLNCKS